MIGDKKNGGVEYVVCMHVCMMFVVDHSTILLVLLLVCKILNIFKQIIS